MKEHLQNSTVTSNRVNIKIRQNYSKLLESKKLFGVRQGLIHIWFSYFLKIEITPPTRKGYLEDYLA